MAEIKPAACVDECRLSLAMLSFVRYKTFEPNGPDGFECRGGRNGRY